MTSSTLILAWLSATPTKYPGNRLPEFFDKLLDQGMENPNENTIDQNNDPIINTMVLKNGNTRGITFGRLNTVGSFHLKFKLDEWSRLRPVSSRGRSQFFTATLGQATFPMMMIQALLNDQLARRLRGAGDPQIPDS